MKTDKKNNETLILENIPIHLTMFMTEGLTFTSVSFQILFVLESYYNILSSYAKHVKTSSQVPFANYDNIAWF